MIQRYYLPALLLTFFASCKVHPDSNRDYDSNHADRLYKLRLNPVNGSVYAYDITNETQYTVEVNDKKIDNLTRTSVGAVYTIHKDTAGGFLMDMVYDKIHLYTKNGDTETDMDADKAGESAEPGEKLLGILKGATIEASLDPQGEIRKIEGFDAIKQKIMTTAGAGSPYAQAIIEKQWDQRLKEGMIRKNMEQLFTIFPDSAVHLGDRWKLEAKSRDEFNTASHCSYQLKTIRDGVAIIHSEGDISSDTSSIDARGSVFVAQLKGHQEGEFEMEMSTGMLLHCEITSEINGDMTTMGKDIPVSIHSTVKMVGRKEK